MGKNIDFGPLNKAHGYSVRWVENVSDGLRLVGFADEIARTHRSRAIDHKGWYAYDDGDPDEVIRGVVYQLPARGREPLFVYGYADPVNDDCALLCFDPTSNAMEAARMADNIAERFAESERDYHRAWDAGRRFADLGEEIKAMRGEALKLGEALRTAKRNNYDEVIHDVLRENIADLYRSIQRVRVERAKLIDSYGSEEAFKEAAAE